MIAIDTNVLLRYLLNDDDSSVAAEQIIHRYQPVMVPDVVLAELVWVLEGRRISASRDVVIKTVFSIFSNGQFVFEDKSTIFRALMHWRNQKSRGFGFADALIRFKSEKAIDHLGEPFEGWATFDRGARELPGTF